MLITHHAAAVQAAASMRDLSSRVADVRQQLESDEQLRTLMAGLRGSNIDDSDYAADGVTMSLVEVPSPISFLSLSTMMACPLCLCERPSRTWWE